MKKACVIYYSLYNHVERLVGILDEKIEVDKFRIETKGSKFWIMASQFLGFGKVELPIVDLEDYETIYLAGPVWGAKYSRPVRKFFDKHNWKGKKLKLIISCGGSEGRTVDLVKERLLLQGGELVNYKVFKDGEGNIEQRMDELIG